MLQPYELDLIKQQLGYPLTRLGAEPWVTYTATFDLVIQPFLFDNSTTSSTTVIASAGVVPVTAASNPAAPNNAAFLVFGPGTQVVVDVGAAQEITTIQAVSGLVWTMSLQNAHTAPWPIWPNGAEWAVRGILARIATIESNMGKLAPQTAGVQQVDEIKLYASSKGLQRGATHDTFGALVEQRSQARRDLSGATGVPNLWEIRQSAGAFSTSPY